ncbi:MAG: S1C family serine protease [Phycisphaerae bacterium]
MMLRNPAGVSCRCVWRGTCGLVMMAVIALASAPVGAQDNGYARAIELSSRRVVKLYGLGAGQQVGYGTGIVVDSDGLVVTNLSLLIEAEPVRVTDFQGQRYTADVLYRDRSRQLALLQLEREQIPGIDKEFRSISLPSFSLDAAVELEPGDWVVAAGNAFKVAEGDEPVSIAHGVFSIRRPLDARRRVKDFPYKGDVLVIDAITSNPGGPGSAVVNLEGKFVGMVGRWVTSNLTHTHFNYAIPADVLRSFVQEALDPDLQMEAARARAAGRSAGPLDIGLRMAKAGYQQTLPFVERVKRSSPAAKAGIRRDDLILSVNGRTITSVDDYNERMRGLPGDALIDIVLKRRGKILTVQIKGDQE